MNTAERQRQQLLEEIKDLPVDVLQEVTDFITQLRQKTAISEADQSSNSSSLTPYEALMESGLIGCGKGPSDLSTNYKTYLAEDLEKKYGDG